MTKAEIESLDTVLVGTQPTTLVLHADGVAIGYALLTPEFCLLVKLDGSQMIRTTEDHLDIWLERLSADMGRPVEIWS